MPPPLPTASPVAPSPADPTASTEAPPQTDPAAAEAAAWAEVLVRWDDESAHQAYLARFPDLDGLAAAGRRYREVLAARPDDARALAMKGEIVKRATVIGLALLPRTRPPAPTPARWKRVALLILAAWLASALAWLLWKAFGGNVP